MRTVRACPARGGVERSRAHQDGGDRSEAERGGAPPFRMAAKGILAGSLAAVAIVGSTIAGAWYEIPGPAADGR